jgi:hypothetical protein
MGYEKISFDNLLNGAAKEKFNYELSKISENIADLNTTEASRELNIKIKLKPDEERRHVSCTVSISSKVPSSKDSIGLLHFVEDKGTFHFVQETGEPDKSLFDGEKKGQELEVKEIINQRRAK